MKKEQEQKKQKMIKVSDLRVNPDNPRTITKENVDKLKKSISELPKLMEIRPIVADMSQDGLVLGGNQRLQAIKLLGMTEIPETWVIDASHLTDEEKQKFIIADNASFGDWDWDILANQWDENLLKDLALDVPFFDNISNGLDYSVLDGADIDDQLTKFARSVKKGILIEFDAEDYEEAQKVINFWREKKLYIGAFLVEKLKEEKSKL